VEYATREQAQNAVATLSNQNLMGRLVYVREDREAEPRFTNPGASRGGFEGGMGGRGGFGGGFGGPPGGAPGGGGRQVYVANVCAPFPQLQSSTHLLTFNSSSLTTSVGKT
jgi:RNA recognition motif-containing protein